MLVSAVIADGPPRRVLEVVLDGRAELILPKAALVELRRVLGEKLQLDDRSVGAIAALIEALAAVVTETPEVVQPLSGDPDDDRIIAAAVAADADVLVSGDRRHMLPLGRVGSMRVLKPQDLLAEIAD